MRTGTHICSIMICVFISFEIQEMSLNLLRLKLSTPSARFISARTQKQGADTSAVFCAEVNTASLDQMCSESISSIRNTSVTNHFKLLTWMAVLWGPCWIEGLWTLIAKVPEALQRVIQISFINTECTNCTIVSLHYCFQTLVSFDSSTFAKKIIILLSCFTGLM